MSDVIQLVGTLTIACLSAKVLERGSTLGSTINFKPGIEFSVQVSTTDRILVGEIVIVLLGWVVEVGRGSSNS
jgi:hypothetical protein